MKRPVAIHNSRLVLPPVLCAPVEHYVMVWAAEHSAPDAAARFDKRFKAAHRFAIADTRGVMTLTVPIAKSATSRCLWSDIDISDHGRWWDVHRVALESAYGRTPYFEFYIDSFLPMLTADVMERFPKLTELQQAWDAAIREHLGMESAAAGPGSPSAALLTFDDSLSGADLEPYRQIRADRLGFLPGLSVLDLLFNLGPEAALYLNREARRIAPRRARQA